VTDIVSILGHVPGALSIALRPVFATWLGLPRGNLPVLDGGPADWTRVTGLPLER
jgi:hypothetical protein